MLFPPKDRQDCHNRLSFGTPFNHQGGNVSKPEMKFNVKRIQTLISGRCVADPLPMARAHLWMYRCQTPGHSCQCFNILEK